MPSPLPPDVRARLQQAMVERVLPRFGGDPNRQQSEAARKLKISPSSINRLVNQGTGGSIPMIEKVESFLNDPPGTILGYANGAAPVPKYREMPGFEEVLAEAERYAKANRIQLTRRDLEFAGDVRQSPPPKRLTAELLLQTALACMDDGESAPKRSRKK